MDLAQVSYAEWVDIYIYIYIYIYRKREREREGERERERERVVRWVAYKIYESFIKLLGG